MNYLLYQSGIATDGKKVIAGIFRYYETTGLPLDVIFEELRNKNCIPDWFNFAIDAIESGMKMDRVLSKLDAPISDIYGPHMRDVVLKMLYREGY